MAEAAQDPVGWAASIQRYQETAKWTITVLGGIGAALIASLSISGLGMVEGRDLLLSVVGVALGLIGVALAIAGVVSVLAPMKPDFFEALDDPDVKAKLSQSPAFLLGYPSAEELRADFETSGRERVEAYRAMMAAKAQGQFAEKEKQLARAKRAEYLIEVLTPAVEFVKLYGFRVEVRRKFYEQAVPKLIGGSIAIAVGITMFAIFSSADEAAESPSHVKGPLAEARLDLSNEGVAQLGALLGAKCGPAGIGVLVLGVNDAGWDVATLPGDQCPPIRLDLPKELGSVH